MFGAKGVTQGDGFRLKPVRVITLYRVPPRASQCVEPS